MRLALSYLDDPHAPSSAVSVLSRRKYPAFLTYLFNKIGFEPSAAAKINLRRMDSMDWVGKDPALVNDMDDACKHAAVQPARLSIEPEQFTSGPLSPGLAARQARLSEIYKSIFAASAVEATDGETTDGDEPDGPERDDRPEQQHASADAATPEPDPVPA